MVITCWHHPSLEHARTALPFLLTKHSSPLFPNHVVIHCICSTRISD
jgi:hypothetical protein